MVDIVLSLGTNLGDRAQNMRRMETALGALLVPPLFMSCLMETEPLGGAAGQPWYFNRLLRGRYGGTPHELLDSCQDIEKRLGRERTGKNAPRTADIDILLFGKIQLNDARLVIPHPRIADRRFCIEGLSEIAPETVTGPAVSGQQWAMRPEVLQQEIRYIERGNEHAAQ
ncbi:MAG: 2-amino-4-hydroxy-6-hydroxymethyldihydropteridine diphosphokinase [Chitinispirillaceae bacterium]|nr:2-amino-4-hydroxy-6-hydroxymethyldihydropteridine diphosphokinase [Chitinispirillaceae bacterium]